ncbi:MAG TPA: hypothetical protein VMW41_04960 [Candidatus Bathyarchaeia archaeon]|nr:hypothetical protein [Candidatus Bathyarchaeia archaeon]
MTVSNSNKQYPRFFYKSFSFRKKGNNLFLSFEFFTEPNLYFKPELVIFNLPQYTQNLDKDLLNNLVFHLGLIEILSYWKATCSPEIIIEAGYLNKKQISWWHNLILKGMGEFFYTNQIDFKRKNFLTIKNAHLKTKFTRKTEKAGLNSKTFLVPFAGGKDSIVTAQLLKKNKEDFRLFCLNPTSSCLKSIELITTKQPIIVQRTIDPQLLELNKRGYLNGHTPFTAYLSFLGVICTVLFDCGTVIFSNERSANEGNLIYRSQMINHQYSKSWEFEKKFSRYCRKYLIQVNYLSLLRPLYEIQITKIFSRYPQYFGHFKSCNVGQKENIWCQHCAKCLATFTLLYPFISQKKIIEIFGINLLDEKDNLPILKKLLGTVGFKPFECVPTKEEVKSALYLAYKKDQKNKYKLSLALRYFKSRYFPEFKYLQKSAKEILNSWGKNHSLTKRLTKVLKEAMRG